MSPDGVDPDLTFKKKKTGSGRQEKPAFEKPDPTFEKSDPCQYHLHSSLVYSPVKLGSSQDFRGKPDPAFEKPDPSFEKPDPTFEKPDPSQ